MRPTSFPDLPSRSTLARCGLAAGCGLILHATSACNLSLVGVSATPTPQGQPPFRQTAQHPTPPAASRTPSSGNASHQPATASPASIQIRASGSPAAPASPAPLPSQVGVSTSAQLLMRINAAGGLCVYGECDDVLDVMDDGSFTETANSETLGSGKLPQTDVDDLRGVIQKADFKQIESMPFTGTCPTAMDGRSLVYTFAAPGGPQTISDCKVAIDYSTPLFEVANLVNQHVQAIEHPSPSPAAHVGAP